MISTTTKVQQKSSYTKDEEREMLIACLLASGFKEDEFGELKRAEGESITFFDDAVIHYVDYTTYAQASNDMPYYAQALILVASGAIHQNLCSSFNL